MKREDIYWHLTGISPSLAIHVCVDVVNGMHWLRQIILIKYTHLQMPHWSKSTQSSASPPLCFPCTGAVPALWPDINSPEHCCFILSYIKIKGECVSFLSASVYLQMRTFNLKEWPNSEVVSKTWWLMLCLETRCKWLVFYCIKIRDS